MSSIDAEDLIARLSGGLSPADRAAFRKAAESAVATSPDCSGEGSTYRVIAKLWRSCFHPPRDTGDSGWYATKTQQNKLIRNESSRPDGHNRDRRLRVARARSATPGERKLFTTGVNTPPPKGGGFEFRLKAGFCPPFGGLRSP